MSQKIWFVTVTITKEKTCFTLDSQERRWLVTFTQDQFTTKNWSTWWLIRSMHGLVVLEQCLRVNQLKDDPGKVAYDWGKWKETVWLATVHLCSSLKDFASPVIFLTLMFVEPVGSWDIPDGNSLHLDLTCQFSIGNLISFSSLLFDWFAGVMGADPVPMYIQSKSPTLVNYYSRNSRLWILCHDLSSRNSGILDSKKLIGK